MKISIIVAYGKSRQIGKDNSLLWHIPEDLKNFKKLTMGHHILMGRKTFDSIGKALPGRTSLILTRNQNRNFADGVFSFSNFDKAVKFAQDRNEDELFVIGGGEIYKTALPFAQKLYVAHVDYSGDGDTFFPEWNMEDFNLNHKQIFSPVESTPYWEFCIYEKN